MNWHHGPHDLEWNGKILASDNQLGCSKVLDRIFSPNSRGLAPKRAKWPHRFKPSQTQGTPQHVASGTLGRTFWGLFILFMVISPQLDPVFFAKGSNSTVEHRWDMLGPKKHEMWTFALVIGWYWVSSAQSYPLKRFSSCWIPVPIAWPRLLINFKCHKLQQAFSGLQDTKGNVNFSWIFLKNSSGRCSTTAGSVQAAAAFCLWFIAALFERKIPKWEPSHDSCRYMYRHLYLYLYIVLSILSIFLHRYYTLIHHFPLQKWFHGWNAAGATAMDRSAAWISSVLLAEGGPKAEKVVRSKKIS